MSSIAHLLPTPFSNQIKLKKENHPSSLMLKNLSIPESISYGHRIGNVPASIMLASEDGAEKLANLHKKQGGIDYDLNYERNGITKQLSLIHI
jgi:hypothetical protein